MRLENKAVATTARAPTAVHPMTRPAVLRSLPTTHACAAPAHDLAAPQPAGHFTPPCKNQPLPKSLAELGAAKSQCGVCAINRI